MPEYNPAADSSADYQKEAVDTGRLILDISGNACLCGCKEATQGRFRPGHDAKLKGKLLRAHLGKAGVTILRDDNEEEQITARAFAKKISSDKHDWSTALDRAAEKAKAAADALKVKASQASKKLGKAKEEGDTPEHAEKSDEELAAEGPLEVEVDGDTVEVPQELVDAS